MKVLVIQQRHGIGDMVIFLPYLHAISKKLNTSVSVLAKNSSRANDLFNDDPHIDEIILLHKKNDGFMGLKNLIKDLRKRNFDKVFIFNGSFRYYIAAKLAGIKKIYQYPLFTSRDVIFKTARDFTQDFTKSEISTEPKLILRIKFFEDISKKYSFQDDFKHIILGISASGPTKIWPLINYINLIKELSKFKKVKFYIVAGKEDINLEEQIIESDLNGNIFFLSDLTIKDILPIIKMSDCYIGNDTGFLHISAALGLKCLGIFIDSPAYSYSAYTKNIHVIVPKGETILSTSHKTLGKDKIDFSEVLRVSKKIIS